MTEKKDAFKLVGIKLDQKTTNKDLQSSKDCGELWQKFEKDKIFDAISNKISKEVYAVYFDYEKGETTPYSYFIGCKVEKNSETPKELQELLIPSQKYSKFTAKGVMTGCVTDAWKEIWNAKTDRKFGFDFEVYDEKSQDWSNAEVAIYVSTSD